MELFNVFYAEWIDIVPGRGNREQSIAQNRLTERIHMFGPSSRSECEKYTEKWNHYRAVWFIEEAPL
jgi:hypothetical protein